MPDWNHPFFLRAKALWLNPAYARWRKLIVTIFGFTVVLIGVAMIVLPGPALIVIPLGLAVLGTEFLWARNLLKKINVKKERVRQAVARYKQRKVDAKKNKQIQKP